MSETKICPYCGEEILAVAKKCRYCGEWLETVELEGENEEQRTDIPMEEKQDDYEAESLEVEQETTKPIAERLERVIRNFSESNLPKSKFIHLLGQIPDNVLEGHKKYYAAMERDERVLLALNSITTGLMWAMSPGLCITDKFLYYKLYRSTSFFALYLKQKKGVIPLSSIDDISLGETYYRDGAFYAEFLINGESIGVIQLQTGLLNDNTEDELMYIFENL